MQNARILIPARYASRRFPGKPLALIKGRSMIERVYQNCHDSGVETAVVTDSEQIEQHILSFGGRVFRVDDNVPSGSERIALASNRFFSKGVEHIINVQGDEPLIQSKTLMELLSFHQKNGSDITTLVKKNSSEQDFGNPNIVKAVLAKTKQALYFSRSSVPSNSDTFWQHIGVYIYKKSALDRFVSLDRSPLESLENLEQLRALENGMTIFALETHDELIGVDVPEDIEKVEAQLKL